MSRQDVAGQIGYVPLSSSSPLATTVFDTFLMGREGRTWQEDRLTLEPGRWQP